MSTKMPTTVQFQAAHILESALYALMIPGAWGKGSNARRADGESVAPTDPSACTFCSMGALDAARFELGYPFAAQQFAANELLKQVKEHRLGGVFENVIGFNDGRNRKEPVLEVFAKAADKLRGL